MSVPVSTLNSMSSRFSLTLTNHGAFAPIAFALSVPRNASSSLAVFCYPSDSSFGLATSFVVTSFVGPVTNHIVSWVLLATMRR